jgi:hypothetical protein
MSDTLSETKACDLLSRLFRARGYTISRNVLFREYGVEFHVDGWDEKARVGFEFLSSEDEDHIDLSLEEYQTLSDAQRRGELALFVIDEVEPLSAAELAAEAQAFLDEADAGLRLRRRRGGRAAAARKGAAARKSPAQKRGAVANVTKKKSMPVTKKKKASTAGKAAAKKQGRGERRTAKKSAGARAAQGKKRLRRRAT